MKQVIIESIDALQDELNSLANNHIFRGHASADWLLESSLERLIGSSWSSDAASKCEERSLELFSSKFHLYSREDAPPHSKLSWFALMQHHGVPTRLLDFTESPYIALYFALEAYDTRAKRDLAVFAIDYTAIMQASIDHISKKDDNFHETRLSVHKRQDEIFAEVVDRGLFDIAWITEPKQFNARLDRQAGSFLLSGNPQKKIQDVLDSPLYSSANFTKYTIRAALYPSIFALLRKMNVTSKSLYGDIDGLARSIRMELQVYYG